MSQDFKSLRHPNIESSARVWRSVAASLDLSDLSISPTIVGAPAKRDILAYGNSYEEPAREEARLQVLFSALSTFAKALEAAESAKIFRQNGRTASSLLLSYDAAYFSARAVALFLGFSPIDANSDVSVDIFKSFGSVAKNEDIVEDNFSYFVSGRWEHKNVWSIAYRIAGTIKKTDQIEHAVSILRKDKMKNVSSVRNRQSYSGMLYTGDVFSEADFPNEPTTHKKNELIVCNRYSLLFESLAQIISEIIRFSKLEATMKNFASQDRLRLCGLAA